MEFKDYFGTIVKLGDTVRGMCIDSGRGAREWTMGGGVVVGFKRTRILVKLDGQNVPTALGAECFKVVS